MATAESASHLDSFLHRLFAHVDPVIVYRLDPVWNGFGNRVTGAPFGMGGSARTWLCLQGPVHPQAARER